MKVRGQGTWFNVAVDVHELYEPASATIAAYTVIIHYSVMGLSHNARKTKLLVKLHEI